MANNQGIYRLTGLSKTNSPNTLSATCEPLDKEEIFWAIIKGTPKHIQSIWDYCRGNWSEPKQALIKYDHVANDGTPINGTVVEITEINQ